MRIIYSYIVRQILLAAILTVLAFIAFFVVGNLLRELLALVASGRLSPGLLVKAVSLLVPFVGVFAIPLGLLTATLLVFGRIAADGELTAAKAAGISLAQLSAPVLLLGLVFGFVTAVSGAYFSPAARLAYKQLLVKFAESTPALLLSENRFIREIPGFILYINTVRNDRLEGIKVYRIEEDNTNEEEQLPNWTRRNTFAVVAVISAPVAYLTIDTTNGFYKLLFPEAEVLYVKKWQVGKVREAELNLPITLIQKGSLRPKISEMTIRELIKEYYEALALGIEPTPITFQIHKLVAFSFAPFSFCLIGIGLGVLLHRKETSAGIAMALGMMLIYYGFFVVGQAWRYRPEMHPHVLLWTPNFMFLVLGAILLAKADN